MEENDQLTTLDRANFRFQCINIVRDLTSTRMQCNGKECPEVDYDKLLEQAEDLYQFVLGES